MSSCILKGHKKDPKESYCIRILLLSRVNQLIHKKLRCTMNPCPLPFLKNDCTTVPSHKTKFISKNLRLCPTGMHSRSFKKRNCLRHLEPGDSIRDLFLPDRWRSPFQPLSSGHVFTHHPKRSRKRSIARSAEFSLTLRPLVITLPTQNNVAMNLGANPSTRWHKLWKHL